MSLTVEQLESLMTNLERLEGRLMETTKPENGTLSQSDPLVQLAEECEFFLPSPLTVESLLATVRNKINNVTMLLDRARENAEIPPTARAVMENEYLLVDNGDRDAGKADQEMVKTIETR